MTFSLTLAPIAGGNERSTAAVTNARMDRPSSAFLEASLAHFQSWVHPEDTSNPCAYKCGTKRGIRGSRGTLAGETKGPFAPYSPAPSSLASCPNPLSNPTLCQVGIASSMMPFAKVPKVSPYPGSGNNTQEGRNVNVPYFLSSHAPSVLQNDHHPHTHTPRTRTHTQAHSQKHSP